MMGEDDWSPLPASGKVRGPASAGRGRAVQEPRWLCTPPGQGHVSGNTCALDALRPWGVPRPAPCTRIAAPAPPLPSSCLALSRALPESGRGCPSWKPPWQPYCPFGPWPSVLPRDRQCGCFAAEGPGWPPWAVPQWLYQLPEAAWWGLQHPCRDMTTLEGLPREGFASCPSCAYTWSVLPVQEFRSFRRAAECQQSPQPPFLEGPCHVGAASQPRLPCW